MIKSNSHVLNPFYPPCSLSWMCNLFRVGTLVLWVHDCADVFLESAKMLKYAGREAVSDILFYLFAISWMVTRLGYFPAWILYR